MCLKICFTTFYDLCNVNGEDNLKCNPFNLNHCIINLYELMEQDIILSHALFVNA